MCACIPARCDTIIVIYSRSIVVYYLVYMCCIPRITKPAAAHNNQCFIVLLLFFALRLLRNDITPWVVQTVNGSNPTCTPAVDTEYRQCAQQFLDAFDLSRAIFLSSARRNIYRILYKGFLRIFMFGFRTEHHGPPLLRKLQVL